MISAIRAWRCVPNVLIPAWYALKLTAVTPSEASARASNELLINSPAESSVSTSRGSTTLWLFVTSRAISNILSVDFPIADTTTTNRAPLSRLTRIRRATD